MRVSLINMRSMKQMGLTIRSSASMISFMLQSQSSIGRLLQVAPGLEFMGDVTREMTKHDVRIRRGNVNVYRDQGLV